MAIVLILVVLVAIAVQAALPRIAERRIHARLTERGGTADVRVRAFPATRLLRTRAFRQQVAETVVAALLSYYGEAPGSGEGRSAR